MVPAQRPRQESLGALREGDEFNERIFYFRQGGGRVWRRKESSKSTVPPCWILIIIYKKIINKARQPHQRAHEALRTMKFHPTIYDKRSTCLRPRSITLSDFLVGNCRKLSRSLEGTSMEIETVRIDRNEDEPANGS